MQGGRPHGVFEVVPNAITSHVPPDPNPGDDMLLEPSPNHDHSNGASDRCAENADTAVPDPETSYHSSSHRKWGRYRCGSIENLPHVCLKAERADTVVSTTATKERGASPAVSSNSKSATATKERVDTAVSSTSSGKPPHDEHTTACERNPQRERRQPSQTPQHRTTHPQQQSKTRAETAVSSNSSGKPPPFQCKTASARKPQREWAQLRKTPQRRTPETAVR